jgi:hypothetical protein
VHKRVVVVVVGDLLYCTVRWAFGVTGTRAALGANELGRVGCAIARRSGGVRPWSG